MKACLTEYKDVPFNSNCKTKDNKPIFKKRKKEIEKKARFLAKMVEEFNGLVAKTKTRNKKIQLMLQGIVCIGLVQSQAKLEVSLSMLEAKLQACKKFFGPGGRYC